jgi:hypothetical protein
VQSARKKQKERRRFPRLYTSAPIVYRSRQGGTGTLASGKGVLKNISLGGAYFSCQEPCHLTPGDVREFVIDTIAVPYFPHVSRFKAQAKVVRLEPASYEGAGPGVAIQFLSPLAIDKPSIKNPHLAAKINAGLLLNT